MININTKEKIYKNYIGLKVTDLQYDLLLRTFCKGKRDQLSVNLRNWIFEQIKEPVVDAIVNEVIEYSLTEERDGRTGIIFYDGDMETDPIIYDSREDAMKHIPLNAKERR